MCETHGEHQHVSEPLRLSEGELNRAETREHSLAHARVQQRSPDVKPPSCTAFTQNALRESDQSFSSPAEKAKKQQKQSLPPGHQAGGTLREQ